MSGESTSGQPIPDNTLIDFYNAWMIEITDVGTGFHSICRSPTGEQIYDRTLHSNYLQAWQAAMQLINHASACTALKRLLRDLYEAGKLRFEEWQVLSGSLDSQHSR